MLGALVGQCVCVFPCGKFVTDFQCVRGGRHAVVEAMLTQVFKFCRVLLSQMTSISCLLVLDQFFVILFSVFFHLIFRLGRFKVIDIQYQLCSVNDYYR